MAVGTRIRFRAGRCAGRPEDPFEGTEPSTPALLLFPSACGGQGAGSQDVRSGPSEVTVLNVDGPPVRVTLWQGAESSFVACGQSERIPVEAAPSLPWGIFVRNAVTESTIAKRCLSDSPHHLRPTAGEHRDHPGGDAEERGRGPLMLIGVATNRPYWRAGILTP